MNTRWTPLVKSLRLLSREQRLSWALALSVQGVLSFLDLLGVLLVGLTTTISVRAIQGSDYGSRINSIFRLVNIDEFSIQAQVFVLASATLMLFTSKTVVSAFLTKRMIRFFSFQGAHLSRQLFRDSLPRANASRNHRNTQEAIFAISTGVNAITHGIYIQSMQILTDSLLLVILVIGVFVIEPISAFSLIIVFGITGTVLALSLGKRASDNSRQVTYLMNCCSTHIELSLSGFRDIYARGALQHVINEYDLVRNDLAYHDAKLRFLPLQSKFIMETVMISSLFLVAGIQFVQSNGSTAIGSLSIFFAAALRVSPAILRIQQAYLSLRGALASSYPTFDLIDEIGMEVSINQQPLDFSRQLSLADQSARDSEFAVLLRDVSFRYSHNPGILKSVSLNIPIGSKLLITGDSGSGKSTLLDLILGILEPTHGYVRIFGYRPKEFVTSNPGQISYAAQKIWIPGGKIRNCLVFGLPSIPSDKELMEVLELTKLTQTLPVSREELLNLDVGPYGTRLSGGQLQRLGIARAVLGNPKLLILDESTNALDAESEAEIIRDVYSHLSKATIITISHRPLAVEKFSNLFLCVDKGRVFQSNKPFDNKERLS